MATIIEALDTLASKGWWKEWQNPAWKQLVLTGDDKHLKKLPKFRDHSWLPSELLSVLPDPDEIDDHGKRFLQACHAAGHPQALGVWIQQCAMKDTPGRDQFPKACALVLELGCPKQWLEQYFSAALDTSGWHRKNQGEYKTEVFDLAVQKLRREALPLLEACFATDQPEVQLRALQLWAGLKVAGDTETIAAKLRQLFAVTDAASVTRAVRLAGDLVPEAVESDLWSLFSHKSRPVRDASACTLARLGESRLSKAKELWAARRADTRLAAVAWLKALGTARAASTLKARLDDEEDDDVRDAILLALEKLDGGALKTRPAELRERIKKTLAKIDGSPVPWLDPKKLPLPKLKNGKKLDADSLLYLIYRQSRVKEMRADIEAKPLFAQIDHKASADLALAVLQAFFGSKIDADDRWAMAFAAIVGDELLVPVFSRQIKEWADNMRGKLAEYAVLVSYGDVPAIAFSEAMGDLARIAGKSEGQQPEAEDA